MTNSSRNTTQGNGSSKTQNAIGPLRADHQLVSGLFTQYEKVRSTPKKMGEMFDIKVLSEYVKLQPANEKLTRDKHLRFGSVKVRAKPGDAEEAAHRHTGSARRASALTTSASSWAVSQITHGR